MASGKVRPRTRPRWVGRGLALYSGINKHLKTYVGFNKAIMCSQICLNELCMQGYLISNHFMWWKWTNNVQYFYVNISQQKHCKRIHTKPQIPFYLMCLIPNAIQIKSPSNWFYIFACLLWSGLFSCSRFAEGWQLNPSEATAATFYSSFMNSESRAFSVTACWWWRVSALRPIRMC